MNDALEAIKKAKAFIDDMGYVEFSQDDKTFYAIIRTSERVGEARKKYPRK
jgi:uncharacterized protein with HEPN domain